MGSSWGKSLCIVASIDGEAISFPSNKLNSFDPTTDVCNDLSDTTRAL
jgi:hypothetical protein